MALIEEIKALEQLWRQKPSSSDFFHLYHSSKWGERIQDCVIDGIRLGISEAIDDGIFYLEADPWFFRSGYCKARIAHALKSQKLSENQKELLRDVILKSLDSRLGNAEFREYARLAICIANGDFIKKLGERMDGLRTWASMRAKFIFNLCRNHAKRVTS